MTRVDFRFDDIVIESRSIYKGWRSTCKTCSSVHKVTWDEFEHPSLTQLSFTDDGIDREPYIDRDVKEDTTIVQYVSEMRSWNCCHEGDEPIDGLPAEPDSPRGVEWK